MEKPVEKPAEKTTETKPEPVKETPKPAPKAVYTPGAEKKDASANKQGEAGSQGDDVNKAGDKIDEASRQRATERIEALRKVLTGEDHDAIQVAFNELEQESHAIAQKLYESSGNTVTEEPETAGATAGQGEDVIDAEFKEEK